MEAAVRMQCLLIDNEETLLDVESKWYRKSPALDFLSVMLSPILFFSNLADFQYGMDALDGAIHGTSRIQGIGPFW